MLDLEFLFENRNASENQWDSRTKRVEIAWGHKKRFEVCNSSLDMKDLQIQGAIEDTLRYQVHRW